MFWNRKKVDPHSEAWDALLNEMLDHLPIMIESRYTERNI